ncbi:GNAT family N-acetyltransferase [Amniculibacterium aquaticum]|uniref:GNAT family N-acetyltransferase n=1 Tax=Amniculibacterium aquaticum TaxID=2479858 RepID=UPI000F591449|nr:GNAT family N-acetyltransferase [Amniculibacterium aquaticum]
MDEIFEPKLLKDKARLQEIYDLRIMAYENSPKSEFVNRQIFPNGLFDNLDARDQTLHWIIEDKNKIIASARIAVCYDFEDLKYDVPDFLDNEKFPKSRPFAYYSRLIVHHEYRKFGFVKKLDKVRVDYLQNQDKLTFALAWATSDRHKALKNFNFINLGDYNYSWGGSKSIVQSMFILTLNNIEK